MVTRIMLSLKKAANSHGDQWSLGDPTTLSGARSAGTRDRDTPGSVIALHTLRSKGREGGLKSDMVSYT